MHGEHGKNCGSRPAPLPCSASAIPERRQHLLLYQTIEELQQPGLGVQRVRESRLPNFHGKTDVVGLMVEVDVYVLTRHADIPSRRIGHPATADTPSGTTAAQPFQLGRGHSLSQLLIDAEFFTNFPHSPTTACAG